MSLALTNFSSILALPWIRSGLSRDTPARGLIQIKPAHKIIFNKTNAYVNILISGATSGPVALSVDRFDLAQAAASPPMLE
jgi:hypothetical protein